MQGPYAACLVVAIVGPAIAHAQTAAPPAPIMDSVIPSGADQVQVSIKAPPGYVPAAGEVKINYTIFVRDYSGTVTKALSVVAGAASFTLPMNAKCNFPTTFTAQVANSVGTSPVSNAIVVTNKHESCPAADPAFTAAPVLSQGSRTANTVALAWKAPPQVVRSYLLEIVGGPVGAPKNVGLVTSYSATLTCAPYSFRVAALNNGNVSAWSNKIATTCSCTAAPAAIANFTVKQSELSCSSGLGITFAQPATTANCPLSYTLDESGVTSKTLGPALPDGSFSIAPFGAGVHKWTLRARNAIGTGPLSPVVTYTCPNWLTQTFQATDIAVGKNGAVWFIDGDKIYQLTASGPQLIPGGATRIAVDPEGNAWIVNADGAIYTWFRSAWLNIPWDPVTDVGVGANGNVFVIRKSDGRPLLYNGAGAFKETVGTAVRISVGTDGYPWIVTPSGQLHRLLTNGAWEVQTITNVSDVSVGAGGTYVVGGGGQIYRWNGSSWVPEERAKGSVVAAGSAAPTVWVGAPGKPVVKREMLPQ
ncbi:MAG: hypothetical protein QM778_07370 [Myxococcales bacterium]